MKAVKVGHQGDIFIMRVTELPAEAFEGNKIRGLEPPKSDRNTYVLHHGEVLGNDHEVAIQDGVEVFDQGWIDAGKTVRQMVIRAQKEFQVNHVNATSIDKNDALHKSLFFPAGDYIIRTQQESLNGMTQRVSD